MINWVENNVQSLTLEYNVEYKFHTKHSYGDIFPTLESFIDAYNNGTDLEVTQSNVHEIGNATSFSSPEELFSLIKSYRSYPEFRNEKTFQAIIDGMNNGAPMLKPIILKKNESLRQMSGNTRQNLALIIAGSAIAKVIEVPTRAGQILSNLK